MIRVREVSGSMLTTGLLVYWNDSGARGAECNADKPVHFKYLLKFMGTSPSRNNGLYNYNNWLVGLVA